MTSAERAAAKETARLKKQAKWNEDRAYKRLNDDDFIAHEQAATKKSNAFTKAAKAFTRHFSEQFDAWMKGTPASPAPQSQPTPTTDATADQPLTTIQRLKAYSAFGARTPTAQSIHESKLGPEAAKTLAAFGMSMEAESLEETPKPSGPYLAPADGRFSPPNKKRQDQEQEEMLKRILGG
jgi:hypothetical protein